MEAAHADCRRPAELQCAAKRKRTLTVFVEPPVKRQLRQDCERIPFADVEPPL